MNQPTASNKLANLIKQSNTLEKFLLFMVIGLTVVVIALGVQLSNVGDSGDSPIAHEHPYIDHVHQGFASAGHYHSSSGSYADRYHTHDDYADSYHGHGYITYSDIYGDFADKNHTHYGGCSALMLAHTTDASGTYGYVGHDHYFNC